MTYKIKIVYKIASVVNKQQNSSLFLGYEFFRHYFINSNFNWRMERF